MGNRVNFNRKSNNSKSNKKMLIFIVISIMVVILALLVKSYIVFYKVRNSSNGNTNVLHYNIREYDSLDELLYGYETEYIRIDNSSDITKIYVLFNKDLYSGNKSNQKHFEGIIRAVAEYNNFIDFELIDMTRDIEIKVTCKDKSIIQIMINGDVNYFLNRDSKINSNKIEAQVTPFTIQSDELIKFIENDWNDSNMNLGSKESRCNDYEIYFDEGIKYKKVGSKVFNLIFTEKYEGQVASGLYVTSTPEEVKSVLGNPTFSDSTLLYGYMSEDNYLFFDFINKEISIYPVRKVTEEEQEDLIELINEMNKTQNIKTFASDLMDLWIDYDQYNYNENYVNLKYTLKGIELNFTNSTLGDDGIFICQNYSGNRDIQDLDNVYISDENSVFEFEKDRMYSDCLGRKEQGENVEEQYKMYGIEFAIRFKGDLVTGESGYKGPYFLSRDKSYPDSELDRTLLISSFKWYDDYRVIYSVDNEGIYIYDCRSRQNILIQEIDDVVVINEVSSNQIIYNDNLKININVN